MAAKIVIIAIGAYIVFFLVTGAVKDVIGVSCYGFLGRSTTCMNPLVWYGINKLAWGPTLVAVAMAAIIAMRNQRQSTPVLKARAKKRTR